MRLTGEQKERFYQRFQKLYGERSGECVKRLEELLLPYQGSFQRQIAPIDQRYTILIAYGDAIQEIDLPPLESLRHFICERLIDVITAVHILPFFPYSSDDGFSVIDYRKVRSDLGDWSNIKAIGNNFELMTDLVINHVSSESRWFKDYLKGKDPFRNYFLECEPELDPGPVARPRTTPLLRRVVTSSGVRNVWTTFSPDQIDLNFENPDVLFEMLDILLFYISNGTRIVRLDAVPYIWKAFGTSCVNLKETHEIIKVMRQLIDTIAPQILLLAECNFSDEENQAYFGGGAEAHLIYQFALPPLLLHTFHSGNAFYLNEWVRSLSSPPPGCTFLNITATHDGIMLNSIENLIPESEIDTLVNAVQKRGGIVSYKQMGNGPKKPYEVNATFFDAIGGEGSTSHEVLKRFLCSQTIALSLKGIPTIYINSLMAARNDHKGVEQQKHPRAINRYKWDKAELDALLNDGGTIGSHAFTEYIKRIRIRARHTAFHPLGRQDVLDLPNRLFGILRTSPMQDETIIAIYNISDEPQEFDLQENNIGKLDKNDERILLIGSDSTVRGYRVLLAPYESCWIKSG